MLSSDEGAKKAARHSAANSTAYDLRSAGPVVCHIAGIGFAIANARRVGLGCQGAGRQGCEKGCG
jgi:hypothetical protein